MIFDSLPIWGLFVGTIVVVVGGIEVGYLLGRFIHRRLEGEKDTSVTAISGTVLGLVAFMLAFTFGMVANRYDVRKGLVREEANVLRTAWRLSDFLPEPDRAQSQDLLREYLRTRVTAAEKENLQQVKDLLGGVQVTQDRLWEIAVAYTRTDMDSEVAGLYVQSLTQVFSTHAARVGMAFARVPSGIWLVLMGITILGMMSVGYQTGISGAKPSLARLILALAFGMVIVLIAGLDRPDAGLVRVSQQPLIDLLAVMDASGR